MQKRNRIEDNGLGQMSIADVDHNSIENEQAGSDGENINEFANFDAPKNADDANQDDDLEQAKKKAQRSVKI